MDDADVVLTELRQAEIRIADEVLSTSAEAALENEQIDKAAAMGIAQNLEKEESRGARRWIKVRTNVPGASSTAGDSVGSLEDEGKILGEPPDLEYVLRHREGNTNRRSLERVGHAGSLERRENVHERSFRLPWRAADRHWTNAETSQEQKSRVKRRTKKAATSWSRRCCGRRPPGWSAPSPWAGGDW